MGIAKRSDRESIAIVGGGMMGIVAAMKLAESRRYDVSLFEKKPHLGCLSFSCYLGISRKIAELLFGK